MILASQAITIPIVTTGSPKLNRSPIEAGFSEQILVGGKTPCFLGSNPQTGIGSYRHGPSRRASHIQRTARDRPLHEWPTLPRRAGSACVAHP